MRISNVRVNAASTACDAFANPTGYYVDVQTSASPNGAVRGQFERSSSFPNVLIGVFTNVAAYKEGDLFQIRLFLANPAGTVSADVVFGLAVQSGLFPGCPGDLGLVLFRQGNTVTTACSSSVGTPGSPDLTFARNLSIPFLPLGEYTLVNAHVPPGAAGTYNAFFCLTAPNQSPLGAKCAVSPPFTVGP